jgi:hypothetical protein
VTKVYVGDTGTSIILDCGQSIADATARSIEVKKPDGTTTSLAAVASGTNAIKYDTLVNTFATPGKYKLQAKVTTPAGVWLGETVELTVYDKFK